MNNPNRIHTSAVFRAVAFFGLFSLIGMSAIPAQQYEQLEPQTRMYNMNLPGLDYNHYDMGPTQAGSFGDLPDNCGTICKNDPNCKAWTYVKPGIQGPTGKCWVKSAIPEYDHHPDYSLTDSNHLPKLADTCCISGVPQREFEQDINRPGQDYIRIDFSVIRPTFDEPNTCKGACERDGNCNAWTYVNPGIQGPKGVCYLKNGVVPDAYTHKGMVSGVPYRRPPYIRRPGRNPILTRP